MTEAEVAWAAGFYEGEGCVTLITHRQKYSYLRIKLPQVNREPLERLVDLFGCGWISKKTMPARKGDGIRSDCHEWTVQGSHAERIIDVLYPWLSQKRRGQIDNARARLTVKRENLPYKPKPHTQASFRVETALDLQSTQPGSEGW